MTSRTYPVGGGAELQLAALPWLLSRRHLEGKPCAAVSLMALDHFDLIAADPRVGGVIRARRPSCLCAFTFPSTGAAK